MGTTPVGESVRGGLESLVAPLIEHGGMDTMFSGELGNGLLFAQHLLDDLGLEGRGVAFSHGRIIAYLELLCGLVFGDHRTQPLAAATPTPKPAAKTATAKRGFWSAAVEIAATKLRRCCPTERCGNKLPLPKRD